MSGPSSVRYIQCSTHWRRAELVPLGGAHRNGINAIFQYRLQKSWNENYPGAWFRIRWIASTVQLYKLLYNIAYNIVYRIWVPVLTTVVFLGFQFLNWMSHTTQTHQSVSVLCIVYTLPVALESRVECITNLKHDRHLELDADGGIQSGSRQ